MKKILVLAIAILVLLPLAGNAGHWSMFEHRYKYELMDVLDADKFVKKDGGYWEGYKDGVPAGYAFISKEWTEDVVGYSGKHLETLIGMDMKGILTGARVLFHSEPIVLIGLKEKNYQKFMKQFSGKDIRQNLMVGKEISMDAITGATVTAVVQNSIILKSSRKVASLSGMIEYRKEVGRKISSKFSRLSWKDLVKSGVVRSIAVTEKELYGKGKGNFLELYFGVVNIPSVGRSLLGDRRYKDTVSSLREGESAIFVFSKGRGSFKGSGFARGGIFERFSLEQKDRMYSFRDTDYSILSDIKAKGAPSVREGGLFIIRGKDFEPGSSFRFNLVLPYRVGITKKFKSYSEEYKIPERFFEK